MFLLGPRLLVTHFRQCKAICPTKLAHGILSATGLWVLALASGLLGAWQRGRNTTARRRALVLRAAGEDSGEDSGEDRGGGATTRRHDDEHSCCEGRGGWRDDGTTTSTRAEGRGVRIEEGGGDDGTTTTLRPPQSRVTPNVTPPRSRNDDGTTTTRRRDDDDATTTRCLAAAPKPSSLQVLGAFTVPAAQASQIQVPSQSQVAAGQAIADALVPYTGQRSSSPRRHRGGAGNHRPDYTSAQTDAAIAAALVPVTLSNGQTWNGGPTFELLRGSNVLRNLSVAGALTASYQNLDDTILLESDSYARSETYTQLETGAAITAAIDALSQFQNEAEVQALIATALVPYGEVSNFVAGELSLESRRSMASSILAPRFARS
ncbi:hypothetical protein AK812_SmicGene13689 [Symbiodinium microadriaticum]|uniref:Uncharacterized protein n=1 Tax=Symbiodinium microadriaticum TaxID=2951 RepID=A0A1Q9E7E4_SYMMI|nr:hypothetical protein AK812_SmicGene13689 [Symbiodinium microadriaticum]